MSSPPRVHPVCLFLPGFFRLRVNDQEDLGPERWNASRLGGEEAVGIAGGAGDGQVEDGAGEVGDGDQVALLGGVGSLLRDRILYSSLPAKTQSMSSGPFVFSSLTQLRASARCGLPSCCQPSSMVMAVPAGGSNFGRKRTGWPGSAPVSNKPAWICRGLGLGGEDRLVLLGPLQAEQVLQGPLAKHDLRPDDQRAVISSRTRGSVRAISRWDPAPCRGISATRRQLAGRAPGSGGRRWKRVSGTWRSRDRRFRTRGQVFRRVASGRCRQTTSSMFEPSAGSKSTRRRDEKRPPGWFPAALLRSLDLARSVDSSAFVRRPWRERPAALPPLRG